MNNYLMLLEASTSASGKGSFQMIILMVLLFVGMYFLMIRPQMKRQKEHKNMVAAMAKGDEIITTGGVLGKVTKVSDNYITAEISLIGDKPVEVILQRNAVTSVLPKGTIKAL